VALHADATVIQDEQSAVLTLSTGLPTRAGAAIRPGWSSSVAAHARRGTVRHVAGKTLTTQGISVMAIEEW